MVQDMTTALHHPMPFFNAPTPTIPPDALEGLLDGGDRARAQEQPPHRSGPLGRAGLRHVNRPELDRLPLAGLGCWRGTQAHLFESNLDLGAAGGQRRSPRI